MMGDSETFFFHGRPIHTTSTDWLPVYISRSNLSETHTVFSNSIIGCISEKKKFCLLLALSQMQIVTHRDLFHPVFYPVSSVLIISLVTSCVGLREEEPQTALPYVAYMGVSYSC